MSDGGLPATYIRNRRTKLDPASSGLAGGRRRTSGLRRKEVAQRANISATWCTWLEQGCSGNPSADVLDRIARALTLTEVECEHLFLLGLGRPPEVHYRNDDEITPRLRRLLDIPTHSPATVHTATWDVVAWNRAAAAVLTDYAAMWRDNHVQTYGDGTKHLRHPQVEPIAMKCSAFAVDGWSDLSPIVHELVTPAD